MGSAEWDRLEQQFRDSFAKIDTVRSEPRRTQDRQVPPAVNDQLPDGPCLPFVNEPNTDWSLPHHSEWAESIVGQWKPRHSEHAEDIPLVIAGGELSGGRAVVESIDPSRPELVVGRFQAATPDDAERAIEAAVADADGWRSRSVGERSAVLFRAAEVVGERRGDLLGAMMAEGGKLFTESDPEVSEAIDFCRFYAHTAAYYHELPGLRPRGKGVVVVVSPWNFPLAIPCGGVAAALAAGNTVILKPASDTPLVAYRLCQCLWDAGVPRTALQLVNTQGEEVAQQLVTHPAADVVVLTGGTDTAAHLLKVDPTMHLLAETGGKNATIVTALADRDLAIKNVVASAFGHSGQKCSATSLLILEDEVYHDKSFRNVLCDSVESLRVGSAWSLPTRLGPLIRPASGVLEKGLKELELGESWAVMPEVGVDDNPHLVSPGVKWDVQPQSLTYCTEFFGPLLGVMCVRTLAEAIELVNATGFGLTSGLESLDDREHEIWRAGIRAGNLYLNRSTTGAIVLRQPFGGMGKSNVGPGIKAGGPNYVAQLMDFGPSAAPDASTDGAKVAVPAWLADLVQAFDADGALQLADVAASYEHWATEEFRREHDHFALLGEDNYRRYLAVELVRIRVHPRDTTFELLARVVAARVAGGRIVVSSPDWDEEPEMAAVVRRLDDVTDSWAAAIEFVEETDAELAEAVASGFAGRLRYAAADRVPDVVRRAAAEGLEYVADAPVSAHGRLELLWYLREQSISHRYHRYGNLGFRGAEQRDEPA